MSKEYFKVSERIKSREAEILQAFSSLKSWEDRYKKIIQFGKILSVMDDKYKIKKWQIEGCQSQVWVYPTQDKENKIHFQADSDALITKGLVALVVKYYSGLLPEEILSKPCPSFLESLELQNHLTPTRVGGLFSLLRQVQYYAQGFLLLSKQS